MPSKTPSKPAAKKPRTKAAPAKPTLASLADDVNALQAVTATERQSLIEDVEEYGNRVERIEKERILFDARLKALKNAQLEFITDAHFNAELNRIEADRVQINNQLERLTGHMEALSTKIAALDNKNKTTMATEADLTRQTENIRKILFAGIALSIAWLAALTIIR